MNTPKRLPNSLKWTEEVVKEHLIEIHNYAFQGDVTHLGMWWTISRTTLK